MPELPEVQTTVDTLVPLVVGRRIERVTRLRADIVRPPGTDLTRHLIGRTIAVVRRRGKRIIIDLDDGNRLFVHLGMTGRLTIEPPDRPLDRHCHFAARVGGSELRLVDPRRFGGIHWCGFSREDDLGPEPLTLRSRQLQKLLARTRRAIKSALLDQRLLAGLGNIYADEALFAARIHPLARADCLGVDQVRRLTGAIKRVLRQAIRHRGSTLRDYVDANGSRGAFQRLHRVYRRTGCPCRRCHALIVRITVAQRSTHFCPHCQRQ